MLFTALLWTTEPSFVFASEKGAREGEPVSDVRVLIDISGSMKKHDPDNLRNMALKLVSQLIPEGEKASVWTFGQYVNMPVKHGVVDAAWKETAYQAAGEINSGSRFTNIEAVLERSTWDWKEADPTANRSVILLTDGIVDISRDPDVSAESRKRILNETLSRLKAVGVTIHTISLTDDADKPFLRQFSSTTNGGFEVARNASQLKRILRKLFERPVPVERAPLTYNKILVSNRIREMKLLVLRKQGVQTVNLLMPNGEKINFHKLPANMRWRREERFDQITVTRPMAGIWNVDAEPKLLTCARANSPESMDRGGWRQDWSMKRGPGCVKNWQ
jgi:hypothetical protein